MEAIIDPAPGADPAAVVDALFERGWFVGPGFVPAALCRTLLAEVESADARGELQRAGIGRGSEHTVAETVRGDRTRWLRADSAPQLAFLERMESLRLAINRQLMLGLFDYEAHFALYPPGSFYKRHLDSFRGSNARVVTTVVYLTPDWRAEDGGELVLYDPDDGRPMAEVRPRAGTLVSFFSERIPHEVRPTRRARASIAGWFRRNPAGLPDPAR